MHLIIIILFLPITSISHWSFWCIQVMMRLLLRVVVCARLGCNLIQFVSDRLGDNSTSSPHIPLEIHKHKDLTNQLEKCKSANTENHVDNLPDVNLDLLPPNCCHQMVLYFFHQSVFMRLAIWGVHLQVKFLVIILLSWIIFPQPHVIFIFLHIFFSGNRSDNA